MRPILADLAADAVAIAVFEILDALVASPSAAASASTGEEGNELSGVAALAGLIKVTLFLAVSAAATLLVRRLIVQGAPAT